jgi:hypothetical protein
MAQFYENTMSEDACFCDNVSFKMNWLLQSESWQCNVTIFCYDVRFATANSSDPFIFYPDIFTLRITWRSIE